MKAARSIAAFVRLGFLFDAIERSWGAMSSLPALAAVRLRGIARRAVGR
jgi:hypothetical protein